jgi:hypothetical protein
MKINNFFGWRILKYSMLLFLLILIPTYYHYYGPQNFLWLSDVGLFLTFLALWLGSDLLMSMAAVGVMVLELIWCVAFFGELILKIRVITLAEYMFNPAYPAALRAISLFHIATPIIWLAYLKQFGYQQRAIYYFTPLYWTVLISTYLLTNPSENINWVFMPEFIGISFVNPLLWLITLAIGFPILFFLPTHLLYQRYFKNNLQKD